MYSEASDLSIEVESPNVTKRKRLLRCRFRLLANCPILSRTKKCGMDRWDEQSSFAPECTAAAARFLGSVVNGGMGKPDRLHPSGMEPETAGFGREFAVQKALSSKTLKRQRTHRLDSPCRSRMPSRGKFHFTARKSVSNTRAT